MEPSLNETEVRSFFTKLTVNVYQFYIFKGSASIPDLVDRSTISPWCVNSFDCAAPIAEYVHFLSTTFRSTLQNVYKRAFPSHIKNQVSFLKYSLRCCESFYRSYYTHVVRENNEDTHIQYIIFLFECAFIYEFAVFCFGRSCYKYSCTARSCILGVYYRYFQDFVHVKNEVFELASFCQNKLHLFRESELDVFELFTKASLPDYTSLYLTISTILLTDCIAFELETFVNFPCSEVENMEILNEYCIQEELKKEWAEKPGNLCPYCDFACLLHLRNLLYFKFNKQASSSHPG